MKVSSASKIPQKQVVCSKLYKWMKIRYFGVSLCKAKVLILEEVRQNYLRSLIQKHTHSPLLSFLVPILQQILMDNRLFPAFIISQSTPVENCGFKSHHSGNILLTCVASWRMAPKRHVHQNQQMWLFSLFRKRVFVDITKLRISRWNHSGLSGWDINPITNTLMRDWKGEDPDTEEKVIRRCSRDWNDADKTMPQPPEAGNTRMCFPPEPPKGVWSCWHTDSRSPAFRVCVRMSCCCFTLASLWYLVIIVSLMFKTILFIFHYYGYIMHISVAYMWCFDTSIQCVMKKSR